MNTVTHPNGVKAHAQFNPRFARMRESSKVGIMDFLQSKIVGIDYSTPYVPAISREGGYHFDLRSVVLGANTLMGYGRTLLATDQHAFDYLLQRYCLRRYLSGRAATRGK